MCFGVLGMVTFSDPKELRQALLEMDHHLVSSEMTAPEGGLASLVQHVLHVKLTEVSPKSKDKINPLPTQTMRLCDTQSPQTFPALFLCSIFVGLLIYFLMKSRLRLQIFCGHRCINLFKIVIILM